MAVRAAEEPDLDIEMKHPPYHLRLNKAVDRLLLIETIRILCLSTDYHNFTYYSLAGPFLEDLRLMHRFFPGMKLISLETNEQTYKRQLFHRFSSELELIRDNLAGFLGNGTIAPGKSIFWLDYTNLEFSYFGQFRTVLNRVEPGSIVRITLRAEADVDIANLGNLVTEYAKGRIISKERKAFDEKYRDVLQAASNKSAFMNKKEYATMVHKMIQRTASAALDVPGSKVCYLPIQSTRYDDNTQMLSVTGVVCPREEKNELRQKLSTVRNPCFDWEDPTCLNVPALSIKERMHLESLLPTESAEVLHDALGYNIDASRSRSIDQLSEYAVYDSIFPQFVKLWE